MALRANLFNIWCILMLVFGLLGGCVTQETTVISTNQFIQTNYEYSCVNEKSTFTEIILCYQKQDSAEKAQNKVTNNLILAE